MKSIAFPYMFNKTSTNLVSNYYATKQNLEMLLASDKGSLFGDPYYGSNIKKYLFDQNDSILQDLLIDDIYTCITTFMPQISVKRKDITITADRASVSATLKVINKADFTTNMYNIVLLQTEA